MIKLLIAVLLIIPFTVNAQDARLKRAVDVFEQSLLTDDTASLGKILAADLTYGHSNGWIETKNEMIRNLVTDKIIYKKVSSKEHDWKIGRKIATVRMTSEIEYVLDGKPGGLKMHVLQVWQKNKNGWQLLARQSIKLSEPVH